MPLRSVAGGVRLTVRLTPHAGTTRLVAVSSLSDGTPVLQASVAAPPADGRANDALLRLLAMRWGLPRRDLTLVGGARSRRKSVHIAGDPAALLDRLKVALAGLPRR